MEYNLTEIKDMVTIAKPVIEPLISALIKPKIEQLSKWLKKQDVKNKVVDNFYENKFEEYLARTLNNCQNINILIFQNQQIKIKDIYYPLTIQSSKNHVNYHINDFKLEYINPYNKILISDTAGMGKSTLSRFITLKTIENNLAIPILIELRNLKESHTVLDEIFLQINPIDKSFDKDLILKFLELGHFLIILDGFDEIQLKNQEIIIKDIRDFINKTPANQFILTSRPEGSLASFGDFQLFNILPLKENEAFELIKKYDSICPNKIGDKLIKDIKENFNQTKELLGNPFLVSLIYSTYTYNKDIPSNKVTFYEEIYSALFKRHDLSKDGWTRPKKSKLDVQQFKTILRQLAFDTAVAGTIVYSEPEIIQYISAAKEKCPGLEFSVTDFLDDILSPVPLFQKDGSKIKWAHKSLQDYFAADFIAFDSRKEHIIERIYNSQRDGFLNMLDLFFELDYKTFRNIIIQKLLTQFIEYYEKSYNNIEGISADLIKERKTKTFEIDVVFLIPEKGKQMGHIFEFVQEKIPSFKNERKRSTILHLENLLIVSNYGFNRQIIDLLADKPVHFITDVYKKEKEIKLDMSSHTMLKLDDNPTSHLNTPTNFAKVNALLFYPSRNKSPKKYPNIDYDKAVIELSVIKKEIDKEKTADTFGDI